MAVRTIDILLDLQATPASAQKLKAEFEALEKKAVNLQKAIDRVGAGKNADKLKTSLAGVKSKMQEIDTEANKRILETNLKRAGEQAGKTRNALEKMKQAGMAMGMVGGAILAPFALALKKYMDTAKEDDPVAKRMRALGTQLTDFQTRLGAVVAKQILPALERVAPYIDKVITFFEKNPGFVDAALALGGILVGASTILSTVGTIGTAIMGLQTIASSLGIGGGAAAGSAGLAAGLATIGPMIIAALPAIITAAIMVGMAYLGGNIGLWIGNALAGTNQTWGDIGTTVKQIFIMAGWGWKLLFQNIGAGISKLLNGVGQSARAVGEYFMKGITYLWTGISTYIGNLIKSISAGFTNLGTAFTDGIKGLLGLPKKAAGGMTDGLSIAGEAGREFVMSNSTTRAAEGIIGGGLSQQRLLDALQGGGRKISYYDARRIDASVSKVQRDQIMNMTISALSGAL